MASRRRLALVVVHVLYLICSACGLDLSEFYSFGRRSGDAQLRLGFHKLVNLSTVVMFNGEAHNNLYVNSNGAISFYSPLSKDSQNVPNGDKLVAPFYTGLTSRRTGKVFYRETQEERLLLLASAEVHAGFPNERKFEATSLFIATWLDVGHTLLNKTIYFQVVLISDGKTTFTLFHYNNKASKQRSDLLKSQQTSTTTFPNAGFSFGDELSKFFLPNSGTSDIFQLSQTSNINIPGKWLYMIGSRGITEPQSKLSGAKDKTVALTEDVMQLNDGPVRRSSPDACGESETQCSKDAECKTPNECCVCNSGYHGNGKMCLKNGQSMHMRGNLSGSINGISVDERRFSVFGDVPSKTTYIALDPVSPSVSVLLRVLTPMLSTLGYLFAHPGEGVGNGFSFLGDNFLRRSQVTFETGEIANIRETMLGQAQNGFYKFEIEINGNVPVFDSKNNIQFENYVHTYRYDRQGIMSGYYSSKFNDGEKNYKISVVEVLEFSEIQGCSNVGNSKMAVSEQRSSYVVGTNVLNFALKTEMQDEGSIVQNVSPGGPVPVATRKICGPKPAPGAHFAHRTANCRLVFVTCRKEACGEENRKCHRQAKCVVKDGVEFCNCDIGFQGDGFSCQDVDECLLNIDDCSPNANCNNNLGSYNCECGSGYLGDGKICRKEEGRCGDEAKKCHSLAQCITKDGNELCECNAGYIGDGDFCQDADECKLDIDDCSVNALCHNIPGSYKCACKVGYIGDGKTCLGIIIGSGDVCTADGQQCDPVEECVEEKCQCRSGFLHDGSACADADECQLGIHTCDKAASCSNIVGAYECECNKGYTGDGYKCVPEVIVPLTGCHGKECHDDGYCDRSGVVPGCRCNQGFKGDGVLCQDANECDDGESDCHGYAICTNTIGSYICKCRPGYLGNGRECAYDDPCKDVLCSSYGRCVIRDGSPICQCHVGYYGDGQICRDYNECEAKRDSCDKNARCVNIAGSYKCFCLPGFLGDGFTCESDGSCGGRKCHRNAECAEIDSVKQCQCKNGFLGSGLICVDVNECSNSTRVQCPPFSRCFNTFGSYECRCDADYEWNGVECKLVCLRCLNGGQCLKSGCLCREGYSGERCQWVGDEFLVFTQGSTMQRLSLPPTQSSIGVLLQTTRGLLVALDFDHMNKMIYFTDVARKTIWRVAFNGTGTEEIISEGLSSPEGIAVDYVGGNLYWTDSMFDRVEVSKLDGSDRKVLFSSRLINPRSIVVHPERGTMYWADWNRAAPKIEVANMDGGSRRVFIQQRMGLPNGLTLDRRNNELCWTDAMYGSISCANLDEGRSQDVYSAARYPFGITSFGQFLIWTDWDARTIQQYDRQSFILQPAIRSFRGSSGAFYEIKVVQKPKDIDSHECSKNNGGCSSLCLPKPGGRTCACANGYYLVSKEDTLRLRGLGSGLGSGSGSGSGSGIGSGLNVTISGSGQGGSGSGGSGIKPKSGPTLISSSNNNITSGEAICVDEETYKYLDNLS